MEAHEQIAKFKDYIELNLKDVLLDKILRGVSHIVINFKDLARYDPELADALLDNPEDVLHTFEIATEEIVSLEKEKGKNKKMTVRICNLPKTSEKVISDIRSKDVGKLIYIKGMVKRKSVVVPHISLVKYECGECGQIISTLVSDGKVKKPVKCGHCGQNRFKMANKETMDAFSIVIEESPEFLNGGADLKRFNVLCQGDLSDPEMERKVYGGAQVKIYGIIKEIYKRSKSGDLLAEMELYLEANFIEVKEDDFTNIKLSDGDIKQIKNMVEEAEKNKIDLVKEHSEYLFRGIYGYENVKEIIYLMNFGGVHNVYEGVESRGDIHVILIGDPASGKSQFLKIVQSFAPKSRYVSGKGVSAAGMTATVVKDEFLKCWTLDVGVLPLTNKGIALIDELDKMDDDDKDALHEGLEQQSVTIAKAGIQATLRCETTCLAAANPEYGRFDNFKDFYPQLNMKPTLVNRFDYVVIFKDEVNKERDTKIAKIMLSRHTGKEENKENKYDVGLIKKYICFAKKLNPVISEGVMDEIVKEYNDLRSKGSGRSIPINPRQLDAMRRTAQAHARTRLSEEVNLEDALYAIEKVKWAITEVCTDYETGKLDIDRLETGITSARRNQLSIINGHIKRLDEMYKGRPFLLKELQSACVNEGIAEDKIEEIITQLKKVGEIFEPKPGVNIQRLH